MQSSIINIITKAIRKTSRLLQRDFSELEMLQTSNRSTIEFCNRSYQRTQATLEEELQNISDALFSGNQFIPPSNANAVLLISPIDSVVNLSNSIPFFAITVTYLRKIGQELSPFCSVMYFPITGDLYYANKGGGAWLDKSLLNTTNSASIVRLRVSSQSNIANAIIATDDYLMPIVKLTNTKHVRSFGSTCYNIALLVSGKVDIVCIDNSMDSALKFALDLFVTESGGMSLQIDANNTLVSNYNLTTKLKQIITKNFTSL